MVNSRIISDNSHNLRGQYNFFKERVVKPFKIGGIIRGERKRNSNQIIAKEGVLMVMSRSAELGDYESELKLEKIPEKT